MDDRRKMVGVAGFAPAASRSRSERSPELSYTPSMVGLVGFAPTTSGPPDRRAPELRYRPKCDQRGGIRTRGLLLPGQALSSGLSYALLLASRAGLEPASPA